MTGGLLSTDDNRSLRARLVHLLLFLSGCFGGWVGGRVVVVGAGDPFVLGGHAARNKINVMLSTCMHICVDMCV